MYYKFNVKVSAINNSHDPWYPACKKYYKQIIVVKSTASCAYCTSEDIDYEESYRLKIGVTAKEQHVSITLFDAAHYFFCCDVNEYVHSTSKK
ncbi:hypothetical protein H5410_060625, partial [Solanum commersonii]